MNRAMRRQAASSRSRPGRRIPRLVDAPMIVKSSKIISPLVAILDQLELHDTVDVEGDTPVFRDASDECWYEMSPALQGVIEFFEEVGHRHGIAMDLSALDTLRQNLVDGETILLSQIHQVRNLLPKLQVIANRLSQAEALEILDGIRQRSIPIRPQPTQQATTS
ncbi:hypothetical protein EHF36_10370 [Kerstersia gyiorum]|uniref:hypothetical protein n=1 Tax=Kerstersia gyiorum TaxID=206506 RepID=UPI001070882D|nr:hypothetical protein [Kerstersia gyiorum]QBR40989.1 hypothetical protein EHF36_10370 [Kerstersia gyiorum]